MASAHKYILFFSFSRKEAKAQRKQRTEQDFSNQ
jgi:hypothetical protein